MKYVELNFDPPKGPVEVPEFFKSLENMPIEQAKVVMDENIENIRKSMGAPSLNIAKRNISYFDKQIKGYDGDIRIRIYSPDENKVRPVTVFLHGGGWFGGSLDAVENYCIAYSDKMDHTVVSVEYHLAPESPFPHGLYDCYEAIKWVFENSHSLSIDKEDIYVSGDSAGGNLSAVLCIIAREKKEFKINGQILLYPAVTFAEDNNPAMSSMFGEMIKKWYLGENTEDTNPYVSPILCEDLTNLPKAFIAICEFDPLAKEGKSYAEALSNAGNEALCVMFKNTGHAFIDATGFAPQVPELLNKIYDFYRGN